MKKVSESQITASLEDKAREAVSRLKKYCPEAGCALVFDGEPWKLMVMGRLSAQCTDKRVNEVSIKLFMAFPTAQALADAGLDEVERIIRPCGLYHMKARDIIAGCRCLVSEYGGVLPDDVDTLVKLPGIGRKIANLLVSDIYGKPAIVADTHCIRISGRLGLTPGRTKDPVKVENALRGLIDDSESAAFCHRLVSFGREICRAKSPKCGQCVLFDICEYHSEP